MLTGDKEQILRIVYRETATDFVCCTVCRTNIALQMLDFIFGSF
jgi:hypothetical protein